MFGTPCARMHRAYLNMTVRYCCIWLGVGRPRFGTRCMQARWAASNAALLTPSCCGVFFGISPGLAGSGYAGTPCERMQPENATAPVTGLDAGETFVLLRRAVEPSSAT
jgi:hypothetical protein